MSTPTFADIQNHPDRDRLVALLSEQDKLEADLYRVRKEILKIKTDMLKKTVVK